jgi:hypothetical protein
MSIWTATKAFKNPGTQFAGGEWGMIVLAIISLLALAAVGILMGFHCFITCCEGTTTYGHNYGSSSNTPNSERININVRRESAPTSAHRLSLENRFS